MRRRFGYTMGNPLWDFALSSYQIEGVAPACLGLQDSFGVDVNLLLYAAWLAQLDRRLGEMHLTALNRSVTNWRDQVVKPLRAVRRELQGCTGAADIREGVKALELRAEQEQLDRMYQFYQRAEVLPEAVRPLQHNLELVAGFSSPGNGAWAPAIRALATLFQHEAGVAPGRSGE